MIFYEYIYIINKQFKNKTKTIMKNYIIAIIAVVALASCGTGTTEVKTLTDSTATDSVQVMVVDTIVATDSACIAK